MKAPPGLPDDEMRRLEELLNHIASLNQQISDRIRKRGKSDLSQIQIEPRDPLDILLHELQAESERNKEDLRLQANSINAITTGLYQANTLLKQIDEKLNGRTKRKKTDT